MTNRLIVFEGIDGTGKTTLSKLLVETLMERGIPAVRFENIEKKNEGFNLIKPFIASSASIDASLFFYVASAIHKSTLIKSLLETQWVVCDRYLYSTLAYHEAHGANIALLPPVEQLPILTPDFHFLLLTDEPARIARVEARPDSTAKDREPKIPGGFYDRMERALHTYHPQEVDNSLLSPEETISRILGIVLPCAPLDAHRRIGVE